MDGLTGMAGPGNTLPHAMSPIKPASIKVTDIALHDCLLGQSLPPGCTSNKQTDLLALRDCVARL